MMPRAYFSWYVKKVSAVTVRTIKMLMNEFDNVVQVEQYYRNVKEEKGSDGSKHDVAIP